jgi:predicted DNA-binding mobile mystery protein A
MVYPVERDELARKHLDRRLARLQPIEELARPPRGWLRAIREAIGMTAAQLASRLQVSQPRVLAMEKAEQRGAITLATLERAAEALGCTLVYALVPNGSLDELVRERARRVAAGQLAHIDHSMRLEDQGVSAATLESERDRLTEELLQHPRRLWDGR